VLKSSAGDSTFTIGGFFSDQTKALNRGETVIFDANNNSNYNTIVGDVDANIYGEVKFRMAYPAREAHSLDNNLLYKNPFSVNVTLGSDAFEYTITTDGYYYLTVKFDLDEYK
jgi:hypothetical protein